MVKTEKSTFQFLSELKKNNNKKWFDRNRDRYLQAKKNAEEISALMQQILSRSDASFRTLDPKKCLFRIFRDVRFSKDKRPYKTHFGIWMTPGGKDPFSPGYYLHIEPGDSFFAGGLYMPQGEALFKVRQEIDYNLRDFKALLKQSAFKKHFKGLDESERLKKAPRGFDPESPALEFLKMKSFTASSVISGSQMTGSGLEKQLEAKIKALKPLHCFLREALA
jgi:uncharacterized protein (TIGR02453 family)